MNLLGEYFSAHITSQVCSNHRLMSKLKAVIILNHSDLEWFVIQQKITIKVDGWLSFWWLFQNSFRKYLVTTGTHGLGMVAIGPRPDHRQTSRRQLQGLHVQCYLCSCVLILLLDFQEWDQQRLSPIREVRRASFGKNEHVAAEGCSQVEISGQTWKWCWALEQLTERPALEAESWGP